MKEKLEQEIKHLKQKIARKEKISKILSLIALLWAAPVILGMIVLNLVAEELSESFVESSTGTIGFVVWVVILVILIIIIAFGTIEPISILKKRLRRAERKLNLKNFLDELEETTDSEKRKILFEKILKEAE